MDGIKVTCQCGRTLTAPASLIGKNARCPACGSTFIISSPDPPTPAPPDEPPLLQTETPAPTPDSPNHFPVKVFAIFGGVLAVVTGIIIAAVLLFSGGGGSGLHVVRSQQKTDNPGWTPPPGFTVVSDEGWDKSTGCAMEIEHVKSGIRLRLIPAGEFDMGSPDNEEDRDTDEGPVHKVKISKPFYMGKYEVTQAQWKAIMGKDNNPSNFKGDDNLPVETVSWNDTQEYLKKAGDNLRLPTEAEWEYACRAGSKTRWCFGDNEAALGDYAWYDKNSGDQTHPVGQKKPNAFGLYDMHGNVWEWCSDWYYGEKYYEECKNGVSDPTGPGKGIGRVLRGGSWCYCARYSRSAFRGRIAPVYRNSDFGFRVLVSPRADS